MTELKESITMALMNRFRLSLLFPLLFLPACSNLGPFGAPGPVQSAFSRTLNAEYAALADYEEHTALNHAQAVSFRQKAGMARQGLMPQPGVPDEKILPPDTVDALRQARGMLIQSIQRGDWIDNGPVEALAQTRFDCWLAGAEFSSVVAPVASPSPDAGMACRQAFEAAMAQLAPPQPQMASYAIYFNPNSTALQPDGMATVQQAARLVRGQEGWAGVLTGHTASDETGDYAANLAVRRAMSVRNALEQEGVSLDDLRIADPAPEPDLSPTQQRRVDIQILPASQAGGTTAPVAHGLPSATFGSLKPIF
jgi:outer membrane protein OmpA-like peptidoglycan-associated protein